MDLDLTFIFQLALFLVLLGALNVLLFKPYLKMLEAREAKLAGAKAEIERLHTETKRDLEAYQGHMRNARDQAQREREAMVATGREEERRLLAQARDDIAKALNGARDELQAAERAAHQSLSAETDALARRLVEKVLGREVSA